MAAYIKIGTLNGKKRGVKHISELRQTPSQLQV